MTSTLKAVLFLSLACCAANAKPQVKAPAEAVVLPTFNVDKSMITVSGVSAGAAFAHQFHVAYSSVVSGCTSWAGIPFLCYRHSSLGCMTTPGFVNLDKLIEDADNFAASGDIDDLANLEGSKVYIIHGTEDTVVHPPASELMLGFYQNYMTSEIVTNFDLGASHAVISDHVGTNCGHSDHELYIENCDVNTVYNSLNYMLGGGLSEPLAPGSQNGNLVMYDQTEFFGAEAVMEDFGYFYVPPNCQDGLIVCKLHVFFHGCVMADENIGTDFIETAGFIEVADANDIVLLFPENKSNGMLGGNPNACFDWFGYTGGQFTGDYGKKDAPQMAGMYDVIARAAGLQARK